MGFDGFYFLPFTSLTITINHFAAIFHILWIFFVLALGLSIKCNDRGPRKNIKKEKRGERGI